MLVCCSCPCPCRQRNRRLALNSRFRLALKLPCCHSRKSTLLARNLMVFINLRNLRSKCTCKFRKRERQLRVWLQPAKAHAFNHHKCNFSKVMACQRSSVFRSLINRQCLCHRIRSCSRNYNHACTLTLTRTRTVHKPKPPCLHKRNLCLKR